MKKKVVKVCFEEKENTIKEYTSFSYSLLKEETNNKHVKLYFVRDDDVDNEILKLEDEYNLFRIPAFWPLIALGVLTFALFTALLVVILVLKNDPNKDMFLLVLGIPSALMFVALSAYYYFRQARINKNIYSGQKEKEKILAKVKEINDAKGNSTN